MPPKRRTYNTRLIRKGNAYYANEVAALFGIHKNAVLNWAKQGLKTIDGNRPMMIHGSDLAEFLDQRQRNRKRTCKPDEFYCCKCRMPKRAWERAVDLTKLNRGDWLVKAICADCNTNIRRIFPAQNLPELRTLFSIQTISGEHISESFDLLVMRNFNIGD